MVKQRRWTRRKREAHERADAWALAFLLVTLATILGAISCGSEQGDRDPGEPGTSAASGTRVARNSAGGVDITATLVTPASLGSLKLEGRATLDLEHDTVVHLALDTHSGDLRGFDYAANASLSTGGNAPRMARQWTVLTDDSHHLEGVLVFDGRDERGLLRLVIANLGDTSERTLTWDPVP